MDKLVKEKEQNAQLVVVPLDAVPITVITQTGISTSTMAWVYTSKIPTTEDLDATRKLVKAMEEISIKREEIKRL